MALYQTRCSSASAPLQLLERVTLNLTSTSSRPPLPLSDQLQRISYSWITSSIPVQLQASLFEKLFHVGNTESENTCSTILRNLYVKIGTRYFANCGISRCESVSYLIVSYSVVTGEQGRRNLSVFSYIEQNYAQTYSTGYDCSDYFIMVLNWSGNSVKISFSQFQTLPGCRAFSYSENNFGFEWLEFCPDLRDCLCKYALSGFTFAVADSPFEANVAL